MTNTSLNTSFHTLMQGLIYPAFLGTFLVSLITDGLILEMDHTNIFQTFFLFGLFGYLFLETSLCTSSQYNYQVLLLDICEIVAMTVNFGLVGVFHMGILEGYKDFLSNPLFQFTGFLVLNYLVLSMAVMYRDKRLPEKIRSTRIIKYTKNIVIILAVISLPFTINWLSIFNWISGVLRPIVEAVKSSFNGLISIDEILPLEAVDELPIGGPSEGASIPDGPWWHVPAFDPYTEIYISILIILLGVFTYYAFSSHTDEYARSGP